MKKFEVGNTYITRFIGDSNSWLRYLCVKRTEKTVTLREIAVNGDCKEKTFRIGALYPNCDSEYVYPEGKYSMCPVLRADSVLFEIA